MNEASHLIHSLLHSARSALAALSPAHGRKAPEGTNLAEQKRRLAYTLLASNPEVAADLFADADREEARIGR